MKFTTGEVNIICTNLEKSLAFYRDILGFTPMIDEDGFYHMQCGTLQFLLLPVAKQSVTLAEYTAIAQFSVDLIVDDLKAAYQYFREYHVTFAMDWHEGATMFVIRDPDGLPWEIVQAT